MESKASVRSSLFKYYLHDSVNSCRLELIGDLSEAEISELSGCWATAKTTLSARKLVLDVRKLRTLDDSGKQWIILMANEGASLLPETFLRNGLGDPVRCCSDSVNPTVLSRFVSFFRGPRTVPASSSTQAQ